jgi:hypothetical protein
VLACLLNLKRPSYASLMETTSSYLSYIFLALSLLTIVFLIRHKDHPWLLDGLRPSDSPVVKYWKLLSLVRLLVTLLILVFMQASFSFQILTLLLLSVT